MRKLLLSFVVAVISIGMFSTSVHAEYNPNKDYSNSEVSTKAVTFSIEPTETELAQKTNEEVYSIETTDSVEALNIESNSGIMTLEEPVISLENQNITLEDPIVLDENFISLDKTIIEDINLISAPVASEESLINKTDIVTEITTEKAPEPVITPNYVIPTTSDDIVKDNQSYFPVYLASFFVSIITLAYALLHYSKSKKGN